MPCGELTEIYDAIFEIRHSLVTSRDVQRKKSSSGEGKPPDAKKGRWTVGPSVTSTVSLLNQCPTIVRILDTLDKVFCRVQPGERILERGQGFVFFCFFLRNTRTSTH